MRKIIISLLGLLWFQTAHIACAQGSNFPGSSAWKRYQHELVLGVGVCNFLGDLGGLDRIGTDYSPVDLEWSLLKPGITLGYRYRFHKNFALTTTLSYGIISGADSLTEEAYRSNRNLHFKSNIFELATRLEFAVHFDKVGHRYSFNTSNGTRNNGFKNRDHYVYLFGGIGLTHFNPKAELDGKWYKLQPMGTEGQGIEAGFDPYSLFTWVIPVGGGYKTRISDAWSVGIEFGYRFTFTDYMDDVSTVYYNNDLIDYIHGPEAAHFADPSLHTLDDTYPYNDPSWIYDSPTNEGLQRGDPDENDGYMFAQITFSLSLSQTGIGQRMSFGGSRKSKIKL